ncbi:MAG: zinc-finger domain-containing protein [Rhodospirillales bacterium]|nr:zinc-finger domain-containing protein [Rhodospirillales bacterium]
MASSEDDQTIIVDDRRVFCDGGTLGHPGVYINIEGDGTVVCPYCSRRYRLSDTAGAAAKH